MDKQVDTVSLLDLLDVDEDVIDNRLKTLMARRFHTDKTLVETIQLLQYKNLIKIKEDSDCNNDKEYDFAVQLLSDLTYENVDYVCKIINLVLGLNNANIVSKSEHFIQQIFMNIDLADSLTTEVMQKHPKVFLDLKICECALDALIQKKKQISLLFLEVRLEELLSFTDEKLKVYFLTSIVPKLFRAVTGYNILDRIWNYIKQLNGDQKQNALKVLSCLSNYYLPVSDGKNKAMYMSDIIKHYEFWNIILFGLMLDDSALRKISVYLLKRAIDCVASTNKDIDVHNEENIIFQWVKRNMKHYKIMWDDYFILLDSLEENQSNIVLPSLNLFETLNIGECWLNAAFNIGLRHDNTQVKLKCLEYRLKHKIKSKLDAIVIVEVFNDTCIYENKNYLLLKTEFTNLLRDHDTLLEILKAIPVIKWSPVPFYYITDILASIDYKIHHDISDIVLSILKVSCTNIAIRKAAYYNLAKFINSSIAVLKWNDMINFYSILQVHLHSESILEQFLKQTEIKEEELYDFLNVLSKNTLNIDIVIFYVSKTKENFNVFYEILNEKILHINKIINRQYTNKNVCIEDVIFMLHLLSKTQAKDNVYLESIHRLCVRQVKTLLLYILSLFSNGTSITIENVQCLFEKYYEFEEIDLEDNLLQLYNTSILFLKDIHYLEKVVLSLFSLSNLTKNKILNNKHSYQMLKLNTFIDLLSNIKLNNIQNESVGRWNNIFYEKSCETIYFLLENETGYNKHMKQLIKYIENVLECGGYGCLKWILKISNIIVNSLLNDEIKFNVAKFLNKIWNEIEELKSNNQYSPCIEQFVELITQDALLKKSRYNNVVILYCNKIIEYSPMKTNPLYFLILKLNQKHITKYGHLVYILCDILLLCPILKKDERITNNLTLQLLHDSKYEIDMRSLEIHFYFEIQYLAIKMLCSINDPETINIILKFLTNKTDENFRNKQRYHGDSQPHKVLQLTLQHILLLSLKCSDNLDWLLTWSLDLLVKLPHQPSVRICLEWIVALYFYIKKHTINEDLLQILKMKKAPLISQFFILHWLLKHKISNGSFSDDEYDFVLDFLLSHTMGQLFNIRLHAQYLATVLNNMIKKSTKFAYTIKLIEKTFEDSNGDKSLAKLKVDYFANKFDLIANLNPYFIYYLLPKYCDSDGLEKNDGEFVRSVMKDIVENLVVDEGFKDEWFAPSDMAEFVATEWRDYNNIIEDGVTVGTIQKKYIPWKNMTDIDVYNAEKKMKSSSDLIVVASLIDKLPNLGGMARTCEVFGVKTYIVDSLRHLQDKQFQGLSVSAERWINIKEVRPGQALKDYILQKKSEGYSIVAAEQTSSSSQLQTFKFPKKTLLLLGHEKEGVPCDLLPIMNYCVEIPQQGYVRSLNVHVTAAIFIWEYARQNILKL